MMKRISVWCMLTIMVLALVGCTLDDIKPAGSKNGSDSPTSTANSDGAEDIEVTFYYPTVDAMKLVPVEMKVKKEEKWLEKSLDLLAEQPSDKNLTKVFPNRGLVGSLRIEGENAYVDLKGKEVKKIPRGATIEQIIIQSLAHTLTKNSDVERIVLTVDGKEKETLLGHIDILDPIEPDSEWLKK